MKKASLGKMALYTTPGGLFSTALALGRACGLCQCFANSTGQQSQMAQTYRGAARRLGSDFGADSCSEQREGNGGAHFVLNSGYGKVICCRIGRWSKVILGRSVNSQGVVIVFGGEFSGFQTEISKGLVGIARKVVTTSALYPGGSGQGE